MRLPIDFDHFGSEFTRLHPGVDLNGAGAGNTDLGKPVYACAHGWISDIRPDPYGMIHQEIETPFGKRWIKYGHCKEILVAYGQWISEGQQIATIGYKGLTGVNPQTAHLHWEIKKQPNYTMYPSASSTLAWVEDRWDHPMEFLQRVNEWRPPEVPAPPPPADPCAIVKEELTEAREDLALVTQQVGEYRESNLKLESGLGDAIEGKNTAEGKVGNLEGKLKAAEEEKTALLKELGSWRLLKKLFAAV